jgi:hypothetical protein
MKYPFMSGATTQGSVMEEMTQERTQHWFLVERC